MDTLSLRTIDVDTVHSLSQLITIAIFRGAQLPYPLSIDTLRDSIKKANHN